MNNLVISFSTFLYAQLLVWYPSDLLSEYREDMTDLFEENLEAAWQHASWRGVARAWLDVAREFTGIVIPYLVRRVAPIVLAILCSIVFYVYVLAYIDPDRR